MDGIAVAKVLGLTSSGIFAGIAFPSFSLHPADIISSAHCRVGRHQAAQG
jgi:hypothetical protein